MQGSRLWKSGRICKFTKYHNGIRTFTEHLFATIATPPTIISTKTIRCCDSLYTKWAKLKPFLPAPRSLNLTIPITYARSTAASPNATRIVAIHGSPGNFEHYRTLGHSLSSKANVDFIAIHFPDFRYTLKTKEFFQSAEERAAITGVLLRQLGIDEVDLIIGHSAGTYTAVLMCLGATDISVRSLALLCSTTARRVTVYDPEWFHGAMMKAAFMPGVQYGVVAVYWGVKTLMGLHKMSAIDSLSAIAAQYSTRYWDPEQAPKWFEQLRAKDVPRIAMYGEQDKLVSKRWSHLLAADLGNPDHKNHFVYRGKADGDISLVNSPKVQQSTEIVCFEEGGHNIYDQYPDTISDHLLRFVKCNSRQ